MDTHRTARDDPTETAPGQRVRRVGRPVGEYDHLEPLLHRFAGLDHGHPCRAELRDRLARGYLPLATHIAARYRNRGEPVEDLEQVAALALLHAIDRFDHDKADHFLGFAVPTIAGEIRRHFRDRTWSVRVPRRLKDAQSALDEAEQVLTARHCRAPRVGELATYLDLPREEIVAALHARGSYNAMSLDAPLRESRAEIGDLLGEADARIGSIDVRETLRPAIADLPERERRILGLRFFEHMTQSQIASRMGCSQMHVSRLLAQTLAGLRRHLAVDAATTRAPVACRRAGGRTGSDVARSPTGHAA